jgi:hypothetical protein
MKPLYLADEYEKIAKRGFTTLFEELVIPISDFDKDALKIKGFENLIDNLLLIIDNSSFAIKIKDDIENLNKAYEKIKDIEIIMPMLYDTVSNQKTGTTKIKIKEGEYYPILDVLSRLKRDINRYLNNANLIFINREQFDPHEFKRSIKERMINRG